ncbi:MAG: signal recognition particle-docking protein FtsY [Actinobacteria bacterium]|jgi:fused signal recognition particle receptor|nr:signal recognition particle-docking protein FtsY [Actinomycetota bacterium]
MDSPLVILLVIAVLVAVGVVGFVATRSKRGEAIEPPARPRPDGRPASPTASAAAGTATIDPATAAPGAETVAAGEEEGSAVGGVEAAEPAETVVPAKPSFRDRLTRARGTFAGALSAIRGRSAIDQDTWDDLEEALIRADVGVGPTTELLDAVRARVKADGLTTPDDLIEAVKTEMTTRLLAPIDLRMADESPTIWLFVGVNGVGKTTTIGKVGRQLADEGRSVVMAAGDTFRAAAAEQLATWAERCGASLVQGAEGSDPSAVIFDGVAHAAATRADVVLADTAGRLHTKTNLMEELRKVRRVADKGAGQVTEVLLVLDATTGQNGLTQARQFTEAVELTGVVLTKLDGSAKGGIVFAIQSELGIPVKLVGLGEQAEDLVPFDAEQFVDALFSLD